MNTEELLSERAKTHGPFVDQWTLAQALKEQLAGFIVDPVVREGVEQVCLKLSRIAVGDSEFIEHYDDIIGYVTRVVDYLKSRSTE